MILLDEIADRALTFTFTLEWNVVKLECLLVCLLLFSFSLYLDRSRSFVFLSSTKRECRAEQKENGEAKSKQNAFLIQQIFGISDCLWPAAPWNRSGIAPKYRPPNTAVAN